MEAAGKGHEAPVKFLLRQRYKERNSSSVEDSYMNAHKIDGLTPLMFSIGSSCCSQAPRMVRLLIEAGADTTMPARSVNSKGEELDFTPLGATTSFLREIGALGKPATEEHLHRFEAIHHLLLRVGAVHAVSWLWPSDAPFIGHAAESGPEPSLPPLRGMLPILKRRTMGRRGLVASFLRHAVKA